MRERPLVPVLLALLLVLAPVALRAEAPGEGYILVEGEYRITGPVLESALRNYLAIETGKRFADLPALEGYVGDINRRLRNNRVFDLASSVSLELLDQPAGGGARPARLVVDAVTSTTAVAVPFPKYNSDDGLSLAVRFKDFDFLGSLETVTANFDYFVNSESLEFGADFGLPFALAGGDWKFSTDFDLLWDSAGPDLDGSASLSSAYELPGLGPGWTLRPGVSYSYDRDTLEHEFSLGSGLDYSFTALLPWTISSNTAYVFYYFDHDDPYLLESVTAGSSLVLFSTRFLGPLTWSFSAGPYYQSSLPSLGVNDYGFSLSQGFSASRIDWIGNFRKGAGVSLTGSYKYHGVADLPSDRFDSALAFDAKFFQPFSQVLGLNLRILGRWFPDWTYIGETNDFDWDNEIRGIKSTLRGDLGLIANLEFPIDMAQGKFFTIDFLSSEVFLNPFLDFGFVRKDPSEKVLASGQEVFCGGADIIVFPDKARAFSYRLSLGYDLLDLAKTQDIKLSGLELWLGLGLHF